MNNRPGRNNFSQSTGTLKINGGDITINASGDGLDSNGNIYVNGGNITVYGPTDNGNGAIDYDGIFEINAGSLIAAGSSGMAQMPGTDSTINSIMINFNQTLNNSDLLVIKDSNNNEIISFKGNKNYNNIVISNENLTFGNYKIYVNNKEYDEFTISSKNTKIGNSMQTGMMQKQDMVRPR